MISFAPFLNLLKMKTHDIELKINDIFSENDRPNNLSLVLLLEEVGGDRRLPLVIGPFEANAILTEMKKIKPGRPMTHDLFKTIFSTFEVKILSVKITDLRDGVFYSKIVCAKGKEIFEIDSRPSDAIAISLRARVKIYTRVNVLTKGGHTHTEGQMEHVVRNSSPKKRVKAVKISDMTRERLREELEIAVDEENYEIAAKLRDELSGRH